MNARCDALIVGAGPIGLTVACHLRRLGLSVRLIEKRAGPSVHSKAIGLQYRVSEILARLGIVDRFLTRGGSPTTVNLYAGGARLVQLRFAAPAGVSGQGAFQPRAILIPQSETEMILLDAFSESGGTVEWQTEFLNYRQSDATVVAQVRQLDAVREIEADWLVSCEGAHSAIRKQSGIAFHGKSYPLAFYMADVRMAGALPHTENHVWLHPHGSLAALPLPAPESWRLFVEVTRQADRFPHGVVLDDIRALLAERAPQSGATIVGEPLWLSDFRINCRMVDRMHDGRVFLAGDAAHIHSPTGGQGITTGMQDAVNLAWKLARVSRGAPRALLDTYDQERLPHAAEVLQETDRTTTLLFAPSPLLRVLRNAVVLPILRRAWVQRRMFGKFSQLHVHYRRSSLSTDRRAWWRRRRVRAGDRAPDVAFADTRSGARTTLFSLMTTLRPLVLINGLTDPDLWCARLRRLELDAYVTAPGGSVAADRNGAMLIDLYGDFAGLYGLRQDFVCVIRPDGHLGLVQCPPQVDGLHAYLQSICSPIELEKSFAS